MAAYYFDTSAVVKRYDIHETGSLWIRSLFTHPQTDVYLFSEITVVELTSALYRKFREGRITAINLSVMTRDFERDMMREYRMRPVTHPVIRSAADLIKRHPLRAYDAVQLATALSFQADLQVSGPTFLFLSADAQLLQAARREGLLADNPNLH